MITLHWLYIFAGAVFASFALSSARDGTNPKRWGNAAFWGLLALVSLYVGLKKRRGVLRVGGFILFAISLGKIFLYDLPSLSSVQRALSFLAVGGVLLLGGFFYQRLSAQFDDRLP